MLSKNLGEVASGRQFAAEGLHLFAQASRFRLERLSFRFQIAYLVRAQCSQGLPDRRVLAPSHWCSARSSSCSDLSSSYRHETDRTCGGFVLVDWPPDSSGSSVPTPAPRSGPETFLGTDGSALRGLPEAVACYRDRLNDMRRDDGVCSFALHQQTLRLYCISRSRWDA